MANQIEFKLKTSADLQGVNQLKKELLEVRKLANEGVSGKGIFGASDIDEIQSVIKAANTLEHALQSAYDPKINTVNINKFNEIVNKSGMSVTQLSQKLLEAGPAGQKAFLTMTNSLMNMGSAVKQTNKVVEQMGTTLKNTIKWGVSSGLWNTMLSTTQQAYGYVKSLDGALNDIRIVTGKSADEMEKFGNSANKAAKELAVSTKDFTEGALIYFQQGLDEEASTKLAEVTAKAANVTGQSMAAVSEELTAVWRGYGVAAEDAERSVDNLAAIAAHSASNLQELSIGMSKVASAASAMGVGEDQLASQLSTIISVTRQAPESVGTALKTIYARMSSIKAGMDDEGVTLNKYTADMAEMGINVLNAQGQLRDMGDVIEEIGAKWQNMTREQQVALAQTMAGTRQYNNLIALFDNFGQYNDMMNVAANATGTLQQQQETYLDSISAKYEQLGTAAEELYSNLFNTDTIKDTLEGITSAIEVLADFTDAIGGLDTIIPMLGVLGLKVFKDQIGQSVSQSVANISNMNAQLEIQKQNELELERIFEDRASQSSMAAMPALATSQLEEAKRLYSDINDLSISLNENQKQQFNTIKEGLINTGKLAIDYKDMAVDVQEIGNSYQKILTPLDLEISKQEKAEQQLEDIDNEITKITENIQKISSISQGLEGLGFLSTDTSKPLERYGKYESFQNFRIAEDLKDNGATDNTVKKIQQLEQSMKQAAIEGRNLGDVYNKDIVKNKIKKNTNFFKNKDAVDALKETLNHYKDILGQVQKNANDFGEALKQMGIEALQDDEVLENLVQQYRELAVEGKNNEQITNAMKDTLESYGVKAKDLENVLRQLREQLANTSKEGENFKTALKFEDMVAGIVNIASAAGQLAMAWSQIKGLGSIWSDKDLTTGEKVERTVMSLSMAIPMLASAYKVLTDEKTLELAVTLKDNIAKGLHIGLLHSEAAATTEAAAAQESLNIAMEANPIGIIIIALTALITLLTVVDNLNKKTQQGIIDSAEKNIEKHKENKEVINKEIEATNSLSSTLDDLNQKYKEGKISVSEYRQEMSKAYREMGDFESAAKALMLTPEEQQKLINQQKIQNNQDLINENQAQIDELKTKGAAQVRKENAASTRSFDYDTYKKLSIGGIDVETIDANEGIYEVELEKLIESYAKNPERFEEIMKTLHDADREKIESILKASQDSIDEIKTLISENQEKTLENLSTQVQGNQFKDIDLDDISNVEEYNDVLYELSKRAYFDSGAFKSMAEAQEWAAKTLGQYNEELSDYAVKEAQINELAKTEADKLVQNKGESDEHYQKRVDDLYQKLKELLAQKFENLTTEEIAQLPIGFDYTQASEEELKAAIQKAQESANNLKIQGAIGVTSGAIDTLQSGKELDSETQQALDEQLSAIKGLEVEYQELQFIRDKGSQDYLYQLIQINEKLERMKTAAAAEDFSQYLDSSELEKIDVEADTEKFENTIEELMDKDYSVSVAVDADLQSDFDGVVNQLEDIDKYASMIGENFIIAAKDVEEVNNAFPGILENAKILEDGTVQIEQSIAEAAIQSSETAAAASAEETAQRLEQEAIVLDQKAAIYGQMAQISYEEAKNEGEHSAAVTQLKAKNSELEALNDQEVSNTEMDNAKNVADNAQANAAATASSWVSAYQAAANAAIQYSQIAAQAHTSFQTGVPASGSVDNTFSGGQGGQSGQTTAANVNLDSLDSAQAFEDAGKKYEKLQKQYAQMANADRGEAMEVRARSKTTQKGLDNAKTGKGSGKGKGGSSKEKEEQKSELDYYKQLEVAIKKVEARLKALQEREEHLQGDKLVKNLKEQTKAYQKQTAAIKDLYKASQAQVNSYKKVLKDQKYNVKYDSEGNITQKSYEVAYNKELEAYNKAIRSGDEDAIKAAKKRYDNFKEYINKYNEAIVKTEELKTQLMENIQNVADTNLKAFDVKFDADIKTKKAEKSWKEFQQKISKDFKKTMQITSDDVAKIMDKAFTDKSMFNIEKSRFEGIVNQYKKLEDIMGQFNIGDDGVVDSEKVDKLTKAMQKMGLQYTTVADLQKDLAESFEELQSIAEDVFDALQEGWETYLEQIDQTVDKMKEFNDEFENLGKQNEYWLKVAELTAGVYDKTTSKAEQLYNVRKQYYETEINNGLLQIEALTGNIEALQQHLDYLKQIGNTENEDYEKTKKDLQELTELQYEQNLEVLEYSNTLKELELDKVYKDMELDLFDGQTAEEAKRDWNDILQYEERYYDNAQKIYQLDLLAGKYDEAIKTQKLSIKNQERLKKLREEELAELKEKAVLTKDDIALANKRFQIYLAEAKLEEAKNTKNTMKVTRNEEGNWSYQYVADEADIESQKQSLLQEYSDLYDMAKKAYQDSISYALDAKEEYLKRYKEIVDSTEIAEKDKLGEIQKLNEQYFGTKDGSYGLITQGYKDASDFEKDCATAAIPGYIEANKSKIIAYENMSPEIQRIIDITVNNELNTLDNLRTGYRDDLSDMKIASTEALKTDSNSILNVWQDVTKEEKRLTDEVATNMDTVYEQKIIGPNGVLPKYEDTVHRVEGAAKQSWSNIAENIQKSEENAKKAYEAAREYADKVPNELQASIEKVKELQKVWNNVKTALEQCKRAMDNLKTSADLAIQKINQAKAASYTIPSTTSTASSGGGSTSSGGSGTTGRTAPSQLRVKSYYDSDRDEKSGAFTRHYTATDNKTTADVRYGPGYNGSKSPKKTGDLWENFLSGGYTGSWANGSNLENGRYAMLHQKELVLNEKDTANFLDAINTVRDLTSLSSSIGNIIMDKVSNMLANTLTARISKVNNNVSNDNSSVQNIYNINADFPNATDKDSIIAAFSSLPNLASQRVNAKFK